MNEINNEQLTDEEIYKKNYIIKSFSRTNKKNYENYVITRIWHKLDNLNLKPVTQQYVNCKEKYYLIDLYFPQINFAIEVDEEHHKNQFDKDELRMDDIISTIKTDKTVDDFINEKELFRRIDVSDECSLDNINKQIDEVVKHIN
ncbi:MAG: AbaSI family restriction endonuclease [Sphaerochaeta sp.]